MKLLDETITTVARCRLRSTDQSWPYAIEHAAAIDAAWSARIAKSPAYFNGVVHMLRTDRSRISEAAGIVELDGAMWRTDFKSFVYWREQGSPADTGAIDCFGSAIIVSAEGFVLLGRQRDGLNAGKTYLPGGFIDDRDVRADGTIDVEESIWRELAEETGLDAAHLTRAPGVLLTRCGPLLSLGIVFEAEEPAEDLRHRILDRIAGENEPELADIVVIRSPDDLGRYDILPYSRLTAAHVLTRR